MSKKYPSCAIVMELACYLKRMSIKAVVDWAPPMANCEADELANGNTHRFHPAKRIVFKESLTYGGTYFQSACRRAVRWSVSARERGLRGQGSPAGREHRNGVGQKTDFVSRILGDYGWN